MSTPTNSTPEPTTSQVIDQMIDEAEEISGVKVSWLTPAVRKALYGLVASVGTVLIALGVLDTNTIAHILGLIGMLGNLFAGLVALKHVSIKPAQIVTTKQN